MTAGSSVERFADHMTTLCGRPGMFARVEHWEVIVSWLDGYAHGAGGEVADTLGRFRLWLAQRHGKRFDAYNMGWREYVRLLYTTDSERLAALPALFAEFLESERIRNGSGRVAGTGEQEEATER